MNVKLGYERIYLYIKTVIIWLVFTLPANSLSAQKNLNDTALQSVTLADCIQYALKHNPDLQNAKIDEAITEATIKTKLADNPN